MCVHCHQGTSVPQQYISNKLTRIGIHYNTHMFHCPECFMHICRSCRGAHVFEHQSNLFRIENIQWQTKMPGLAPKKLCTDCTDDRKSRLECKECGISLCFKCFDDSTGDKSKAFKLKHNTEHPSHKDFWMIYAEHWVVLEQYDSTCPCETMLNAVNHCERCYSGEYKSL